MSNKRSFSAIKDEQTECLSLSKKIKNFHLNSATADGLSMAAAATSNGDDLSAFGLPNPPISNAADAELQQRLLTEQIVNYSNSIISNTYSPDTGSENNKNYLKINKMLFEANKMRLLRTQVRLLNRPQ